MLGQQDLMALTVFSFLEIFIFLAGIYSAERCNLNI